MKTLLFAGLAGVLAMAPGVAIAATDSAPLAPTAQAPLDVSYASAAALAAGSNGAKTRMPRMGGHRMGGKMGGMKRMGGMKKMGGMHRRGGMKRMGGHQMKRMGGGHRMKMRHRGGRNGMHVRKGRMGYGKGYRRPHRGFQLPNTFIQPSFFIGNYGHYGLSQPSVGYGWSRYYDDAVLTDRRGVVHDTRYNVNWDRYNQGYNDGYHAGQASYDQSVFLSDDRVVAHPSHGHGQTRVVQHGGATTYQGDWNGAYQQDGSYQGDWQGTYRGTDGQVYEGEYSGTFIGEGNAAPVGASYADGGAHWGHGAPEVRYDRRNDELAYLERCKKSSGIGGAVVGGAIGALAGNRIAGRGNRLGGSLIGGGLGAVAGAALEQGTDRCRKLIKKYGGRDHYARGSQGRHHGHHAVAPRRQHHRHQTRRAYPSGWQGHYYPAYYYPQPSVTTVVIQSQPVTTTTTTTTIEEEVYYTKARTKPVYKKRWKPAPKRKWKPAPVKKGCQSANCYYSDM